MSETITSVEATKPSFTEQQLLALIVPKGGDQTGIEFFANCLRGIERLAAYIQDVLSESVQEEEERVSWDQIRATTMAITENKTTLRSMIGVTALIANHGQM